MSPVRRRLGLFIALAVILLSFAGLPGPPPAHASDTLLYQGRPVTVSSTEDPFVGAQAVDGDPGTRWSSAFAAPQWIQVDRGASTPRSARSP
ncbi:discoidin domain-containing protein [Streptomyces lancefieldiae]|uniref:Discoidin domain-containing protein n=1 Tax=Streptomyces lancefieldiae TaxID=3075520 RepID=A0ABU3B188_9ACTN|nr:discoidin domain-containing protein [Streptomyces sp. DSM 40712]MDT0615885.1 discoidin domain-containing protein [Streptomyces sp. DSM 40712]